MPTNINFSASEGQFLDGDETNYTAAANGSLSITFDNSSGNFQLLWHLNTDGVAVGDTDGDTDSFSDSGTGTTPLSVSLSNGSSLIAGWSFGSSGNGSAEVTVNPNGGSDFVGTLSITDTTADGTTASYDIPISITAPPITLAELANAAYTTPTPTSINTPDGSYQEIAQTPTGAPFFAEAFKNGNQIVLAIRGTDPSSNYTDFASDNIFINNVLADASWVGAESPNPVLISYISSALSFLRAIQSDPANAGDIITITGHSLGGAIAQILGAASGDPTVTFDAPGAQQFLAPLQRLNILPNTLPSPSSQDENYRTQGDVVSYRGTQIGPMNTIPSNVTPSWGQALHNHSLGLLISQLLATASPMPGFTDSPLTLSVTDLAVFSSTIGHAVQGIGEQYVGPVAGLVQQYINVIADPLSIAVSSANWFVHSGSGDDAIAVSGGTNVLDGGTGSNFLTGGTGTDTFFVDDRAPPADIWSTVNNFHAGDAATVWGVTPNGFGIQWADGQGAAGFTGLTLHATASGKPTASITLSGYSASDLSNGRLSTSFGFDSASNSPYLYIFGRN